MENIEHNFPSQEIAVRQDVHLRLLDMADAGDMFAIIQADPAIQTRVTWTAGLTNVEAVRSEIEEFRLKRSMRYAIVEGDQTVGYIGGWKDHGYFGVTHENEFGFGYFCAPEARGKAIVPDALQAFMQDIARTQDPKSFALYIADDNLASQQVADKLGFQRTEEVYDEPTLLCKERRYVLEAENLV